MLDDTPADYRPTVQVIDNFARNHKLGVVFEGRVGKGQLLVCGFDLPALVQGPRRAAVPGQPLRVRRFARPSGRQGIRRPDLLEAFFVPHFNNSLQELGAHIRADSHAAGLRGRQAIDGDPNTIWHTPWGARAPNLPARTRR